MKQIKWFDRHFDFSFRENIFPSIKERLGGTPARLDEKFKSITDPIASFRFDEKWSIKENIGHLADLETVWQHRLYDILCGREEMRPTDLRNIKTHKADHNAFSIEELLMNFGRERKETLAQLSDLSEADIYKSSFHPRLHKPMHVMGLFLFVAEHDDHHLARISELVIDIHTFMEKV
ncbi:MAG TPA: DinB family protein [Flavisolibacter sp.]|jgi:hypothetical protein|nr:DinB family protein [Flavisolibacter sp.]